MTENLRQRKRNEFSSNENEQISIDPNEKNRSKTSSSSSSIGLIIVATILIGLFLVIQFALPHEDHVTKHYPATLPTMDGGPLLVNDFLSHSEKIFVGEGPESIEELNGMLYTGLKNGSIIELDPKSKKTKVIYSSLSIDDHRLSCGEDHLEHVCGRPLGIRRFSDEELIIVQAYHGLFKLHVKTKKLTQLIGADDQRFGERPLRFVNDVDVLDGRYLFFTDSDWKYPRKHFTSSILQANPRGRLIRFDLQTGKVRILDDQLSFPNGVQLAADHQSILVCETNLARVVRHWIAGDANNLGKSEVFIENLPGLPDNIRLSSTGNYWIAFAAVRHIGQPTLLDRLRNWPRLRILLSYIPNALKYIQRFLPKYGLVIEVDKTEGHIVRSLHDPEGLAVPSASQVTEYNNHLYFGSYYLHHIGVFQL